MAQSISIADGIDIFTKEFDFNGKQNTRKTYLRALALFKEFIVSTDSDKSPAYRELTLNSSLYALPNSITTGFISWLREHPFPVEYRGQSKLIPDPAVPCPTAKYSIATINLYETGLQRVLRFWRSRGFLSFNELSQNEAEQASTTKNKKSKSLPMNLRASSVPADFGTVMLATANQLLNDLGANSQASRPAILEAARAKCLIHVLMMTGLRASDVVTLTRKDIQAAKDSSGYMQVVTKKSGSIAYCFLDASVFESVDLYLSKRGDKSPWLFIQHGRSGKKRDNVQSNYSRINEKGKLRKGYGAPITTQMVWRIVASVANAAGYDKSEENIFISPHALRHWLAQTLRDSLVPLDVIQAGLGHSSLETTRKIYAPSPNMSPMVDAIRQMNKKKKHDP
jgi:integrase